MIVKRAVLGISLIVVMGVVVALPAEITQHYYICHTYQPMSHLPFPCFQCSATKEYAIHKADWSYIKHQHPIHACEDYQGDYNFHWFSNRVLADEWRWRHCHCG